MHKKLTNRLSRRKTEISIEKHGLYRRERTRHQVIPCPISSRVDHNHQWNQTIIRAQLAKAMNRMNFNAVTLLKTKQMSGFKRMFSSVVDKEECSTIYVVGDASNDANYLESSAKKVIYACS